MGVQGNVFLKGTTLFIVLIESCKENRLFSSLTGLMLFPCLINTVIDEETLVQDMNPGLFYFSLFEVVLAVSGSSKT